MANTSRLCLICGQVFTSDAERRDHLAADHAGSRVEWRDKKPYVVTDDGTATRIGPAALKRMRRDARAVTGGTTATRGRTVVRRSKPAPSPAPEPVVMVETPLPDSPDAPPYFAQVQPPRFAIGGEPVGPAPTTPAGDGPAPTVTDAISRETIKLALDQPTLASMIRNASIVLSDWDGAGERGYLSAIESAQLAMLLHDPAVSMVQRYFGGNVDRFRVAMAVGILLLGKGRVHLAAVRDRIAERRAEAGNGPAPAEAAYLATQPVTETVAPPPPEPEPMNEWEALAERQRRARVEAAA